MNTLLKGISTVVNYIFTPISCILQCYKVHFWNCQSQEWKIDIFCLLSVSDCVVETESVRSNDLFEFVPIRTVSILTGLSGFRTNSACSMWKEACDAEESESESEESEECVRLFFDNLTTSWSTLSPGSSPKTTTLPGWSVSISDGEEKEDFRGKYFGISSDRFSDWFELEEEEDESRRTLPIGFSLSILFSSGVGLICSTTGWCGRMTLAFDDVDDIVDEDDVEYDNLVETSSRMFSMVGFFGIWTMSSVTSR